MKMLLRRIALRLRFAMDTFFWFIEVCPHCPPVQRMNYTVKMTAICPRCGFRIVR